MKNQKHTNWIKKLLLTSIVAIMLINITGVAMAAEYTKPMVNGACPDAGWVALVGMTGKCGNTSDNHVTACTDATHGYLGTDDSGCSAADSGKTAIANQNTKTQEALQALTAGVLAFERMLQKAIWPVLFMTGDLLDNDILFGSGMEERLRAIWVPIRNIVNILFVLALLGLALYNVLGIDSENSQYSIKAMLPKLIAAIIAVNFSFIGIKVFLDAINVLTVAIFALPDEVGMSTSIMGDVDEDIDKIQAFCKQVYAAQTKVKMEEAIDNVAHRMAGSEFNIKGANKAQVLNTVANLRDANSGTDVSGFDERVVDLKEKVFLCNGDGLLTQAGIGFFQKYRSNNAALAMAISSGNILFMDQTYTFSQLASNPAESFAINAIFSLIMYIVYTTAFIALFVVLLVRLVVLWLGLALSPVLALGLVIPMAKDKLGMGDIITKFVAHAVAPVGIAMVMTIGWIMTSALKNTFTQKGNYSLAESQAIPGIPIPGLDTIQGLLISLTTVAVVWVGVFAVADTTLAGGFLKVIKDKMEQGGKWLAKAPIKYTPWIPVEIKDKETGKDKIEQYTPGSIMHGLDLVKSRFETKQRNQFAEDVGIRKSSDLRIMDIDENMTSADKFTKTIHDNWEEIGGKNSVATKKLLDLPSSITSTLEDFSEGADFLRELTRQKEDRKDGTLDRVQLETSFKKLKAHLAKPNIDPDTGRDKPPETTGGTTKKGPGSKPAAPVKAPSGPAPVSGTPAAQGDYTKHFGGDAKIGENAELLSNTLKVSTDATDDLAVKAKKLYDDLETHLEMGNIPDTPANRKFIINQKITSESLKTVDTAEKDRFAKLQEAVTAL